MTRLERFPRSIWWSLDRATRRDALHDPEHALLYRLRRAKLLGCPRRRTRREIVTMLKEEEKP
jgi:hypothetical protein